jgi:CDP-diacylglycerol--glycerol-3-phosphate 3-phosphatidyltransferase
MANLITIGRLILLFIVVWMIYVGNVQVISASMILLILVFASDGLDGWVARKRGSTSPFGAVFDIAGDRIAENVVWIIFADLGKLPIWVPLLVITRGFLVDGLRSLSYAEGMTAFGDKNMMRSNLTRWLTAGRFMRGLFGVSKAAGFVFLCGLIGYEDRESAGTVLGGLYDMDWYIWFGWSMVWLSVVLTVVRGVPVLYDAMGNMRDQSGGSQDAAA